MFAVAYHIRFIVEHRLYVAVEMFVNTLILLRCKDLWSLTVLKTN